MVGSALRLAEDLIISNVLPVLAQFSISSILSFGPGRKWRIIEAVRPSNLRVWKWMT